MTLSPLWHTLLKNVNITVRYQSTLYTAINYIINTVYVWAWDRNNQNITMTPASFALFTTELSNVMYIYIYIDTIIHEDTYPLHCYRFLCIHVKQNVYDMFSTVMWYNFKEVVVQYKMVSAEFLNTFDRHKSVTRSERDFCGSRVFY